MIQEIKHNKFKYKIRSYSFTYYANNKRELLKINEYNKKIEKQICDFLLKSHSRLIVNAQKCNNNKDVNFALSMLENAINQLYILDINHDQKEKERIYMKAFNHLGVLLIYSPLLQKQYVNIVNRLKTPIIPDCTHALKRN